MTTGLGGSKPINKLWGFSAEITEPISSISEVCSSNETTAVCSKFVILHAYSYADRAINIQNLLQNKFCAKSGIIFAVTPCTEPVLENLSNIVNGSAQTFMLPTFS